MDEALKVIGAVAWVIGAILLLIEPFMGVVVLVVALLLSILSASRTRERRHREILDATRKGK